MYSIIEHMDKYTPKPLDTQDIELPDSLMELAEEMARNVHEVWAQNRMDDGWTYGPLRDDLKKQHPCLVPYDQLPERERDYDRATSIQTLRFIIHSGFDIKHRDR